MFALGADQDDAPAPKLGGGRSLSGDPSSRHGGNIIGAEREGELAGPLLPNLLPN
jgi:hypothetical protein